MPCNSSWLVGKKAPGYLDIEGVLWSAHVIFQPFLNIYSILHKIWLVNKWRAESIQRQLPLVPDVVHHRVPGLFSHAERALTGLNPWAVRVSSLPSKVEHSFSLYLQIVIKLICLKVDACGLSLLRRCCRASSSLILELQCVNLFFNPTHWNDVRTPKVCTWITYRINRYQV